ncbi:hypothetical protein [Luteolibacter sp. AS25]|uniref:hypothetical protein n=1 Tax=Luteolibacter sp. AS25 TaxID=3135776 RepID=UPI00398AD8E8
MKKTILVAAVCLFSLPTYAQTRVPRTVAPPGVVSAPTADSEHGSGLTSNLSVLLEGSITADSVVDLSLTGSGPKFSAEQILEDETILHTEYLIATSERGYSVAYAVAARVKVKTRTANDQKTANFEYRDVSITGNVICSLNEPIVLIRNGARSLQLTIKKEAEQGGDGDAE